MPNTTPPARSIVQMCPAHPYGHLILLSDNTLWRVDTNPGHDGNRWHPIQPPDPFPTKICEVCNGNPAMPDHPDGKCVYCHGTGHPALAPMPLPGPIKVPEPSTSTGAACVYCMGAGTKNGQTCPVCGGSGLFEEADL